ncbi:hypothetical protein BDV93DRAFT_517039 [Ceratobasidium sp. AG-I]|nr:hypothetical protein BDV93DRAFT_517039 [Ceratobasidium sp. AG-I]
MIQLGESLAPGMIHLCAAVRSYEAWSPPTASQEVINQTIEESPHRWELHYFQGNEEAFCMSALPAAFWSCMHQDHHWFSPGELHGHAGSRVLYHTPTGTLYGGPNGIRCVVLTLLRVLRATPKRPRDVVQPASTRVFERISAVKRSRTTQQSPFRAASRNVDPAPLTRSSNCSSVLSSTQTTKASAGQTTPYLFTFTTAIKHVLDEVQNPPVFAASKEGLGRPLHTVDEDLEDLLLNQPASGKASLLCRDISIR